MVQPKDKRRKQKKKAPRKSKGGVPLPKSVQALLKYLSGSSTGIGAAPAGGATAAQQFQAAAPPPPPQPAGVVRKPRAKKAVASAPVPSPLQAIAPQAAPATIIQLPAATAPKQETAPETQREIATLRQTARQQEGAIRELKSVVQQQGVDVLFRNLREQGPLSLGPPPSQQPSYMGRSPSAPSWAGRSTEYSSASSAASSSISSGSEGRIRYMTKGRSSMRGSEGGGEPEYVSAQQSVASETPSVQTIAGFLEEEAAGLGEFMGGQYVQNVANPAIPQVKMGRGRPPKSEEEKKATKAAAAQRRKEAKQLQQQQTHSQSLAQLSSLASVSNESSTPFSFFAQGGGGAAKGKASQIFSQAQQSGADPSQTIRAMVAGGGAAAAPQVGGGLSLGEIVAQNKKGKSKKK